MDRKDPTYQMMDIHLGFPFAGDQDGLLAVSCIVYSSHSEDRKPIVETSLFNRNLPFYNWRLKRLTNKLIRKVLKTYKEKYYATQRI